MSEALRLNKLLASHSGIGRRAADALIEAGRVTVNGITAQLGARINPSDTVTIDGKIIELSHTPQFTYVMLHKPVGYVCSRRQQGDAPTIYSLLPAEYQRLKPVGRLDKDSSGLLLLSDDGDFALRMTHPKFGKTKAYEVTLDKPLVANARERIVAGVQLQDGPSLLQLEPFTGNATRWHVRMHEGRNRQIRRTFAALGYDVVELHRTQFGEFQLGTLPSGKLTPLTI